MNQLAELVVAIPAIAACVIVSGFCSSSEVALFSIRRVERDQLSRSERRVDRAILRVLERPRRLIATVLIGNEMLNSAIAILVAVAVAARVAPGTSPWTVGGIALAIALPLVVLIAEVSAKTLAAKAPLAWARACVLPLQALTLVVAPVRWLVQGMSAVVLWPLGDAARGRPVRDLSEQEFRSLVDASSASGAVDARERRMIHRVFEFSDKNVGQVMTARDRIFALSYELPMQRLAKEVAARGFSRVPVYQKSLDNIRGIVVAKDLVPSSIAHAPARPLAELLHEPLFVPRTTPIKRMFLTFKQKKVHMAIVVSEYGKVLGLVTMDDLLAQIFGVLRDERAHLQASSPASRGKRSDTPLPGVPTSPSVLPKDLDTGPVVRDIIHDEPTPPPGPAPVADVEVRAEDKPS